MKNILLVGQCKQGSSSVVDILDNQSLLTSGIDIRAMVRIHNASKDYMSNWAGMDISNTKYLIDKSIINPNLYDYHVENWTNYNHKMIYMIRNIYN